MKDHRTKTLKDIWGLVTSSDYFLSNIKQVRKALRLPGEGIKNPTQKKRWLDRQLFGLNRKPIINGYILFQNKFPFLLEYPVRWEVLFFGQVFSNQIKDGFYDEALQIIGLDSFDDITKVENKYINERSVLLKISTNATAEDVIKFIKKNKKKLQIKQGQIRKQFGIKKTKRLRKQEISKKELIYLYSTQDLKTLQKEANSINTYKDQLVAKIFNQKFKPFKDSVTDSHVRKIIQEMKKFHL